jgi:hypothetical protein
MIRAVARSVKSFVWKGTMITKEDYQKAIGRAIRDERLAGSDVYFLAALLYLFDTYDTTLHLTMREYQKEMNLSMGAISSAIPRLAELGYVRGGLYPNEKGHDSWRLSLADAPESEANARPVAIHKFQHGNAKVTIVFEEEAT